MERGQPRRVRVERYSLDQATKRWWNCISCASQRWHPRERTNGGVTLLTHCYAQNQDFGNTNYSIHVPRTTFDRTVTANVVVRAVRALSVDAYVNERNDICVAREKMSGSTTGLLYPHSCLSFSRRVYPRLRLGIQDCEQSCVSPWNNAHFDAVGYPGRFVAHQESGLVSRISVR
ncbi:hypothetical protein J3R82DRAFT_4563 [Butyriboletus roseoflavus]|nr:hypothetical protein J3R82DRAFT_4563 [Butyriboletus roseoflavus]